MTNQSGYIDGKQDVLINDIINFVTKRKGANVIFVTIPTMDELEARTDLQRLQKMMCTNTAYKLMQYDCYNNIEADNCECEMFFEGFNKDAFEHLVLENKDLYKNCFDDFSEEYLHDICASDTDLVQNGSYFCMPDTVSNAINVKNGIRMTAGQIDDAKHNIFIFGHSTIWGYYNYDHETVASYLQQYVSDYKYNVLNCGSINEVLMNVYNRIINTDIGSGDIVVIGTSRRIIKNLHLFPHIDLYEDFCNHTEKENFFDKVHITTYCNRWIAKKIYENIHLFLTKPEEQSEDTEIEQKANLIIEAFEEHRSEFEGKGQHLGVMVMSCNPFTLGHRHIVELGSKMFDHFIVCIMQSGVNLLFDKEESDKIARMEMEDLENVTVITMPDVISFKTFYPEYNDVALRENKNYIGIDTYNVINIYVRAFTKFNIKYYLVGIETEDKVTGQLVKQIQTLLPRLGMQPICIPRKTLKNSDRNISGTMCRDLIRRKEYDKLEGVLGQKTIKYLKENNLEVHAPQHINNKIVEVLEQKAKQDVEMKKKNLKLIVVPKEDVKQNVRTLVRMAKGCSKEELKEIMDMRIDASIWAGYLYLMNEEMDEEIYQEVMCRLVDDKFKRILKNKHDGIE